MLLLIEVNQLANDLPLYETTLSEKMRALHDKVGSTGVLKNASKMLKDLDRELRSRETDKPTLSDRAARTPIPVEVHQPDPGASEAMVAMLRPLVVPFTTTGIVLIFLIFFLNAKICATDLSDWQVVKIWNGQRRRWTTPDIGSVGFS